MVNGAGSNIACSVDLNIGTAVEFVADSICVDGKPIPIPNCTEPTACAKPSSDASTCAVTENQACICGGKTIYDDEACHQVGGQEEPIKVCKPGLIVEGRCVCGPDLLVT